jgi:hypothetical protein
MLAARRAAATIPVELTIFVICFEITVDAFPPGASGPATRRGLHDDEGRIVLLGHLRWRQPGLLQRRELAEQRLL